jgi:hypothetical protein
LHPYLDLLVRGTNPQIRIRTKMSRISNTAQNKLFQTELFEVKKKSVFITRGKFEHIFLRRDKFERIFLSELCPVQHWEEALWLARCRLEDSEYSDMANKYAEHLLTQGMSTHS